MLNAVCLPEDLTRDNRARGSLYLCPMPGRFEPLDVFLCEIQEVGVTNVVCLVSDEEIARKSPTYLAMIQREEFPVCLWRFDIPDYGMPENVADLDQMLDCVLARLDLGESVVIHCAAGHGRTGMVATLLLMRWGVPFRMAADTVRRAGSAPDTKAQQEFLRDRQDAYLREKSPL